jgi:predicted TIM-barrel fold metal-dependent hydrolase
LPAAVDKPEFLAKMRVFAQTGLTLEVANPRVDLIRATVRLTDKVPDLRVVLGHLQALPTPSEPDAFTRCLDDLRELRHRKAYAKISWLPGYRPGSDGPLDPALYKPGLDQLWDVFSEDFLVYAGRNKAALDVLKVYALGKGRSAAEKFFWKNSVSAYKWIRRDPKQPQLPAASAGA